MTLKCRNIYLAKKGEKSRTAHHSNFNNLGTFVYKCILMCACAKP